MERKRVGDSSATECNKIRRLEKWGIDEIPKRFRTSTKKHVHGFYVKWKVSAGDTVYSSTELLAAGAEWIIDQAYKHIKNDMEGLNKARFEIEAWGKVLQRDDDESSPDRRKIEGEVFYSELCSDVRIGIWSAIEEIVEQLNSENKKTLITLDTVIVRGVFMTSDKYERKRWKSDLRELNSH